MIWQKSEKSSTFQMFKDAGYGDLTAATMCNAGIKNIQEAWDFLHCDELLSPSKIRNIELATQIIWNHIWSNNRICIFGDYDADGITSSTIMFLALKKLGANPTVRLPDRIEEGYGINIKAIKEQIELGTKLFITVDNGVRAIDEIAYIKECGCDVVVLDHHEPGEILPAPDALIDLHIPGETYPFVELTGSGLSWKVAHYMLEQVHEHDFAMSLVDLAAIGTVGDVAPLVGENRTIVKRAIKQMRSCKYNRYGVISLLKDISSITAETIAFQLAPCLNASGRLNERGAELPLILLLENDPQIAQLLAEKLISENERRKSIQADCYKFAKDEATRQIENGNKVLVLCHKEAQSGIAGLLAGNLKEEFNRPAIVFCPKKDLNGNIVWTGSARSIEGFHILDAITVCKEHLLGFGGHSLAAGLTIEASDDKLLEFEKAINEHASFLTDEQLKPKSYWDIELSSNDLTEDMYCEMDALEPFGAGVPKPIVKLDVKLDEKGSHKMLGNSKEHIKLFAKNVSLIGFSLAEKFIKAELPQQLIAYHIAKLMAKINTGNIVDDVKDRGVVTVSDCCCGAGCLLMAFANSVKEAGVNYQKHILFVAQDVDMIAGLMCYIQLSILGCRGYVKIGDSLLNPVTTNEAPSKDIWFTPMYKLRNIITFMEIFDAAKNENMKDTVPA